MSEDKVKDTSMAPAEEWMDAFDLTPDRESGLAVVRAAQANALEAAAKLVESRAPDTFGGNPHTAFLAGALKGIAMAIRELKP